MSDSLSPGWLAQACLAAERDEQACLGAALANDEAARLVARELEPGQFASDSHRCVHAAIAALVTRDEGVDVLTVAAEVERTGGFEGTRGRDYLYVLIESTPAAAHVRQYCQRVRELARQRELCSCLQRAGLAAGELDESAARGHLRAELEAATALLDDGLARAEALPLYDGPSLAEMHLEEPQPLCEGLIYRGCSTDLVAEPKRGKTTMLLSLAAAIIPGRPWCTRMTARSGVLYLSEQSPHSFNPQCARAGLLSEAGFCVLFHRDALSLSWAEVGERVQRAAQARALDLVVIDNLSLWAGIRGEEENEAGVALETLRVIERLTGAGLAVVAVRHARKGGGSLNEAGRGSSAIAGGMDILAQIKGEKRARHRLLQVTGRVFAEEPHDLVIELGSDGRYHYVGEGGLIDRADARRTILALLPETEEEAMMEAVIISACQHAGIGKPTAQALLRGLCDEGAVQREFGAGTASARAYGYWRRADAE
jgi:hypothetical protein